MRVNNLRKNMRGVRVVTVYGGQRYDIQLRALKQGSQVVVGTPGRILDHINRGTIRFYRNLNLLY